MSLECMQLLLAVLDNPHKFARTIHITGSKGKGSTGAMIASILNAAFSSSAFYSSPHLNSYTERLVISAKQVSEGAFAAGIERIRPAIELINDSQSGPVATFGILTALFFMLVRQNHIQWQVVEVGLGGRHDATNLFDDTEVVVITPVSLEHTNILGTTVEKIAEAKAGIIKPGCTVVIAPQKEPSALQTLTDQARELRCEVIDVSRQYSVDILKHTSSEQHFTMNGPYGSGTFSTRLVGFHQLDNAATAIAAVQALRIRGHAIPNFAVENGLKDAWLPGRLETVNKNPLVLVDGAHNEESARALKRSISKLLALQPTTLVLAVNSDKDPGSIVAPFADPNLSVIATCSQNPRSIPAAELKSRLDATPLKDIRTIDTIPEALEEALSKTTESGFILVTGSLYAAGEAREFFLSKKARVE